MRRSALLALAFATSSVGASTVQAGYWCSPGYTASYGRCIATASTDEVDLYLNEPGGYVHEAEPVPLVRHRRHRHGLRERY